MILVTSAGCKLSTTFPMQKKHTNAIFGQPSRLAVVSHVAKSSRSTHCKTNDATTTREDFTGMDVVQIRPAYNPPSTNAIALKLQTLTHHFTSNYHTNNEESSCVWFQDRGSRLQRTSLVFFRMWLDKIL